MPPLPAWFTGREGLRGFMQVGPLSGEWRWRHLPTQANGQPAVGSYAWYEPDQAYRLFALDVFTLEGTRIKAITSFINRSTLSRERPLLPALPRAAGGRVERERAAPRASACPSCSTDR